MEKNEFQKNDSSGISIPQQYQHDYTMIRQELQLAKDKTLQDWVSNNSVTQYNEEDNTKMKSVINNRLISWLNDILSNYRKTVHFVAQQEQPDKNQKIVMLPPDQNLPKRNQVNANLLKQGKVKNKEFKAGNLKMQIKPDSVLQLKVVHQNGKIQNIQQAISHLPSLNEDDEIQNLRFLQQIATQGAMRINEQAKLDLRNQQQGLK